VKIRDKGGDVEYRFMPEPDLLPLVLDDGKVRMIVRIGFCCC